jgi:hypothetical protein
MVPCCLTIRNVSEELAASIGRMLQEDTLFLDYTEKKGSVLF